MPTTSNFGWTTPADTDLVKDGALAIRTLGNGIDTSMAELKGGTTGQVLSKTSNTDMDFTWIAVDPLTILDAKGDLISATAADTPARLAVGTNGQVLTADSTTSTGLKWATPSSGAVKQLVANNSTTSQTIATTTYTDVTGASVTITPAATANKILIQTSFFVTLNRNTNDSVQLHLKLFRGATELEEWVPALFMNAGTAANAYIGGGGVVALNYVDSPSSTSSLTYKVQAKLNTTNNAASAEMNVYGGTTSIVALEF